MIDDEDGLDEGLDIRPAHTGEREVLTELQRRASLMWPDDRPILLRHPDMIDVPQAQIDEGRVLVAEYEGKVLGFAVILPRGDDRAELDGLFVEPCAQDQGIGRHLVRQGEILARANGATLLNVVANHNAAGFYEACGFETVREVETGINTALEMVKPLTLNA